MQMTEIKRSLTTVPAVSEETVNLAEVAASVLGYTLLQETQSNPQEKMGKLSYALANLGIEVLEPESVKTYQDDKMREVARVKFEEWLGDRSPYRSSFYCPFWNEVAIEKYAEPIPEFVLNKAVQIKQAVPDCKVLIEYLNENPDPFLIVELDREKYFIEVWAEPKFEGRLR